MKKDVKCEVCESNPADMDFNCYMPSFGGILEADLCLTCWGEAESDMALAVKVVGNRAIAAGAVMPMRIEDVPRFFKRPAQPEGDAP